MTIRTQNAQRTLKGQNDPEGRARVRRIHEYVLAHPVQTAHQVADALDLDLRNVGFTLCNLARRGKLRTSGMDGRRMTYAAIDYVSTDVDTDVDTPVRRAYVGKPAPIRQPRVKTEPYRGARGAKYVPPVTNGGTGRRESDFYLHRDLALSQR